MSNLLRWCVVVVTMIGAASAQAEDFFFKDGDVVEIEITGIGKLSNKFVKEKNPNGA